MRNQSTNPGTVNPADQAFPAAGTNAVPATSPASASTTSSTGELQLPCLPVSRAAPVPGQGLAKNVRAGDASQVKNLPVDVALALPPAKNVTGGGVHPGTGLAANVCIR